MHEPSVGYEVEERVEAQHWIWQKMMTTLEDRMVSPVSAMTLSECL